MVYYAKKNEEIYFYIYCVLQEMNCVNVDKAHMMTLFECWMNVTSDPADFLDQSRADFTLCRNRKTIFSEHSDGDSAEGDKFITKSGRK